MEYLLTEEELARRMKVSRNTLFLLRKKGLPHRRIGRMIRYRLEDVDKWIINAHDQTSAVNTGQGELENG